MMKPFSGRIPCGLALLASLSLAACLASCLALPGGGVQGVGLQDTGEGRIGSPGSFQKPDRTVRGTADFSPLPKESEPGGGKAAGRPGLLRVQTTPGEVANAATVALIDALTGNTIGSSVTDENGNFTIVLGTDPAPGVAYLLEAIKGLSVGGKPNRPGAPAIRIRTYLYWNGGWQSLTNSTPGTGIVINSATTALAIVSNLKQHHGKAVNFLSYIGKINGASFDDAGTGLSATTDFAPVLNLVGSALALDMDPVGSIAFDAAGGTYRLATGIPVAISIKPDVPAPGGTMTLRGANFDPMAGRNLFWFGQVPAATWSVSADRTVATVPIPAGASSGPFVLQQPGNVRHTLVPFLPIRGTVGTLVGAGITGYRDGPRDLALFAGPGPLALDGSGNLYVFDSQRVRKVSPDGTVSTLAGDGTTGFQDGPGASAKFGWVEQIAADAAGNVYVADRGNHRVRKVATDGTVSTLAGSGTAGFQDGPAASAQFNIPIGVAVSPDGSTVYVADRGNLRIRRVQGGMVSTVAGNGSSGNANGTGASATFTFPEPLGLDTAGNLWISDRGSYLIRLMSPAFAVTTLAGAAGISGYADGSGSAARFNQGQVCPDPTSTTIAYVADVYNARIRKITTGGVVTTLAGSGINGWMDGPLGAAQFKYPASCAVDSRGFVYVSDSEARGIRVIVPN